MARIIVASASETNRDRLSRLLSSAGFPVFRCCDSVSDLRRALCDSEDGIVILMGSLPGCKPDELQWDYGERIQFLLIAPPAILGACEAQEIFRLALPANGQAVIGAVQMLSQLHGMRLPRRTGSDRRIVDQAKQVLMQQHNITEPEAHRMLQQYAMNHGIKMTDYAERVLITSREMES